MSEERLQKLLARAGFGSRRSAEELIRAGRVTIDGAVATLGQRVDAASAAVAIDGRPLHLPGLALTLILHKPPGYVVTASDEHGRQTVYALLPDAPPALRYVGRLDRDTAGLLLFTTDGELAHRLTHPRYHVPRAYEALVEGVPTREALERLRLGVALEDGDTAPATVRLLGIEDGGPAQRARLRLVIHEGRKRQVRRMLDAVGYPVVRLARVAFGPLRLDGLAPGGSRVLTGDEVASLRALVGLVDAAEAASLSSTDRTTGESSHQL